ncbi:hypothetical protein JW916_10760 [Candidatus Sumerlaeota bacterium]|nr:hypothetical protein [Candidatus Sumerlaeota bacterium]
MTDSPTQVLSRRRAVAVFGLAAAATLFLFLVHFRMVGFGVYGDGLGYYAPLRSLAFDRDLDVRNEYEYFASTRSRFSGASRWPFPIPRSSKYTIGMGLVLSPFFLLGHLLALLLDSLRVSHVPPDGLSWPYEMFYCLGSAVFGLIGLWASYKACRLYCGRAPSVVATLGVWFASPLFFYLAIETSMSHAVSQGLVSTFLYCTLRRDWLRDKRSALFLGLLLGLAVLVRPQNILFCCVPVLLASSAWRANGPGPVLKSLSLVAVGIVACAAVQVVVYRAQYGALSNVPYLIEGRRGESGTSFHWLAPRLGQVLFSGYRGLFVWHPTVLLAVVGLLFLARRDARSSAALLVAFAGQVYVVAAWHCWWQGASVGGRMFSNCTLIFALGLASLWTPLRGRALWIAAGVTLFLMIWNTLIIAQYMTRMIPAEGPVTARELIVNQVRVVPRFLRHFERE